MYCLQNKCSIYVSDPLNHSCSSKFQCLVEHSDCIKRRCVCTLGYKDNNAKCDKVSCSAGNGDDLCNAQFGNNVICDILSNTCVCDYSFKYNSTTNDCDPEVSPLGSYCTSNSNCSFACVDNKCVCQLGFYQDPTFNEYICKRIRCNKDAECTRYAAHTKCFNNTSHTCNCQEGYWINVQTQQCEVRKQLLGGQCKENTDCGNGAMCIDNKCICPAGYRSSQVRKEKSFRKLNFKDIFYFFAER